MTHMQNGSPFMPRPLSEDEIQERLKWSHDTISDACDNLLDIIACRIGACEEERRIMGMSKEILRLADQACYKSRRLED